MLEGRGSVGIISISKSEISTDFDENNVGERLRTSENAIPHEQIMTSKLVQ